VLACGYQAPQRLWSRSCCQFLIFEAHLTFGMDEARYFSFHMWIKEYEPMNEIFCQNNNVSQAPMTLGDRLLQVFKPLLLWATNRTDMASKIALFLMSFWVTCMPHVSPGQSPLIPSLPHLLLYLLVAFLFSLSYASSILLLFIPSRFHARMS